MKSEKIICPICGKYEFEEYWDMDLCEVCAWMNDVAYNEDPNKSAGGITKMSLNEYKKAYQQNELWWQLEGRSQPFDKVDE